MALNEETDIFENDYFKGDLLFEVKGLLGLVFFAD